MTCYEQNETKIMALVKVDKGLKYVGKEPSENLPRVRMSWWGNYCKEKCLFLTFKKNRKFMIFFLDSVFL